MYDSEFILPRWTSKSYVFFAFLLLLSLFAFVMEVVFYNKISSYKDCRAIVVESRVIETMMPGVDSGSKGFKPGVRYEYYDSNNKYINNVSVISRVDSVLHMKPKEKIGTKNWAESIASQFNVGDIIIIKYDGVYPKNSYISSLNKMLFPLYYILFIILTFIISIISLKKLRYSYEG